MAMDKKAKYYRNKLEYIQKYNKENYYNFLLRFNREHDKDIIEYLDGVENKQGLMKKLLREEMSQHGPNGSDNG